MTMTPDRSGREPGNVEFQAISSVQTAMRSLMNEGFENNIPVF